MSRPLLKREKVCVPSGGTFLGLPLITGEIKPRMEKVEAIINMTPPKNIKVQRLNGWVARVLFRTAHKVVKVLEHTRRRDTQHPIEALKKQPTSRRNSNIKRHRPHTVYEE